MTDDGAARAAIATDLSSTLFVEAGAGSGKTTQLVARILEILLSGRAGVDQLAAITFTEAAAGELRDRLAERLEQAAIADPVVSRRAAAADALAGLEGAAVTTLHGFARRILADHPFAAGLPAVFEVLDEVRSAIAFDDRWAGTVDALLADPDASAALSWLLAGGAQLDDLRVIAQAFDAHWDRIPSGDGVPPAALPRIDRREVLDPLRRARALALYCDDPDDRLLHHLEALGPTVERLEDSEAEIDVLRVLAGMTSKLTGGNRGRPVAWGGRKADVQSCLDDAQAGRDRIVADAVRGALGQVGLALATAARAPPRPAAAVKAGSTITTCSSWLATSSGTTRRCRPRSMTGIASSSSTSSRTPTRSRPSWPFASPPRRRPGPANRSARVAHRGIQPATGRGRRSRSNRGACSSSATRSSRSTGSAGPTWRSSRRRGPGWPIERCR